MDKSYTEGKKEKEKEKGKGKVGRVRVGRVVGRIDLGRQSSISVRVKDKGKIEIILVPIYSVFLGLRKLFVGFWNF